ncbi:MAG: TrkH family potassium uptake protein [Myxococcota bacterium]
MDPGTHPLRRALGRIWYRSAPAPALRAPRALSVLSLLVTLFVVGSEALIDLSAATLHGQIVVALDVAVVVGFAVWTAMRTLRVDLATLRDFLREERVNLLLIALSLMLLPLAPRVSAAVVIARLAFSLAAGALNTALGRRAVAFANLRPPLAVAVSFLGMIGMGTVLLMFPAATRDGHGASLVDAAFTISSATSVTGLVVQDTGTYWSPFGLAVISLWIQFGAIGIMALAAAFAVFAGGRLPVRTMEGLDALGMGGMIELSTVAGLKRLIIAITGATLVIEFVGGLMLFGLWALGWMPLPPEYDSLGGAIWWSLFNSLSAFCHAGFVLSADSLVPYASNTLVNLVFLVLITLGGFGFAVIADLQQPELWRRYRQPRRLWQGMHIQTRMVLIATLVLNLAGMLAFLVFEYDGAMSHLGLIGKLNAALFQSVTLRSAGFNTIDIAALAAPSVVVCMLFMFIGSGPGSTGGGVRVTTAYVVVMAIRAMLRGRDEVEAFGRTLPKVIVYRSISIVLIAGLLVAVFLIALSWTQTVHYDRNAFETMSAFGPVGVSMGVPSELDSVGKWLIAILMYFGRVGPLTLALAIGERATPRTYRYPEGRVAVG